MVTQHSTTYPGRTSVSIQRKSHDLHRIKVTTCDPNCPEDVWREKRVKYVIGDRAEVGSGEETYKLEGGCLRWKGDCRWGWTVTLISWISGVLGEQGG